MWLNARVEGHKEKDKPVKILSQRTSCPVPAKLHRKIFQWLNVISYGLHSVYQLRLLPLEKSAHHYCMQNNILELMGKQNIFPPTNLDFRSNFFSLFYWKQTKPLNRTLQLSTDCKAMKRWEMFHRVALYQYDRWSHDKLWISPVQYCLSSIYSHPRTKDIDVGLNTACLMSLISIILGRHFIFAGI